MTSTVLLDDALYKKAKMAVDTIQSPFDHCSRNALTIPYVPEAGYVKLL